MVEQPGRINLSGIHLFCVTPESRWRMAGHEKIGHPVGNGVSLWLDKDLLCLIKTKFELSLVYFLNVMKTCTGRNQIYSRVANAILTPLLLARALVASVPAPQRLSSRRKRYVRRPGCWVVHHHRRCLKALNPMAKRVVLGNKH